VAVRTALRVAALALLSCGHPAPRDQATSAQPLPTTGEGLPAGVAVLEPTVDSPVLSQCSRPSPPAPNRTWAPQVRDVVLADKLLEQLASSRETCRPPRPFASAIRQYLGLVYEGRQLLYVNAVPIATFEALREIYPEHPLSDPFVMCDGGSHYWGALVDPQEGRVLSLQFNGDLGMGYECEPAA
jgi:hypothetical protein